MKALLYMRVGCHLCGEAYEALRRLGLEVEEVDVESSGELEVRFGERVPVIEIGGRVISEGPVTVMMLKERLQGEIR